MGLILLTASCGFVWAVLAGYPLLLLIGRALRRRPPPTAASLPPLAVVIPTLDEERLILDKLNNTLSLEYPRQLLRVWVVDGGSNDETVALVRGVMVDAPNVRLLTLRGRAGKLEQLRRAFDEIEEEFLIVTDADAELEADCARELVAALVDDPRTGMIGASVIPESSLDEERLHWCMLNTLWWLEGEALSAATVSGVCYALRRSSIPPLPATASADDIHVAMAVATQGWRVRMCRTARAVERRVPRNTSEMLRFRRRRGVLYLRELLNASTEQLPLGWRVARTMRILHVAVVPWVAAIAAAVGAVLLSTDHRLTALGIMAVPTASVLTAILSAGFATIDDRSRRLGLGLRYLALTWMALLTLTWTRRGWRPKRGPDGEVVTAADGDAISQLPVPLAAPVRGPGCSDQPVSSEVPVLSVPGDP